MPCQVVLADTQGSPSVLNLPWTSADVLETSGLQSPSPSKQHEVMDASALNLSGTTVRHLSQPLESPKVALPLLYVASSLDCSARSGRVHLLQRRSSRG
eukprot:760403-Hanusia_phi.AAC.9